MAIIIYTGVMGSGKSYEGVSTAALTALRQGRRVVTNIAGFNYEAIRDFLGELQDGTFLEPEKVVVIQSKRITEPNFFYDPDEPAESVVCPGDLVLIDEVWTFWGKDAKLLIEHQKFFRMHRHYTEVGTGTSCDLVMMIQDLGSLHRSIRGVIESNLRFTKMKSLGLSSRYKVEVFEGNRQARANLVSTAIKKYDKKIFPLYKSYDGGVGRESVVDGRQNLFNSKFFIFSFLIGFILLIAGGWWLFGYYKTLRAGGEPSRQTAPVQNQSKPVSNGSTLPASRDASTVSSSSIRLVGLVEHQGGEVTVVFQLPDGSFIRERMDGGQISGWSSSARHEGNMVVFKLGSDSHGRSKQK